MSRKSENSTASGGDGDLALSSHESSPRGSPDYGATGPFGDHFTAKIATQNYIIYKGNDINSSSDSNDEEYSELKKEYLKKLEIVREKLASIDIANKNYYNSCFRYMPTIPNQCTITEIDNNIDKADTLNDSDTMLSICEVNISNIQDTKIEAAENVECDHSLATQGVCDMITMCKGRSDNGSHSSTGSYRQSVTLENAAITELDTLQICDVNAEDFIPVCEIEKESDAEIRTILNYGNSFDVETSSTELLDLNYNPPKKKLCIRELTPKLALSEGALPLPYHISVSLRKILSDGKQNADLEVTPVENIMKPAHVYQDEHSDNGNHIFPEIQIKYTHGSDDKKFVSNLEYKDTTTTIKSPSQKPKKKSRLLMHSARNKVKPVDSISRWEEIRTMEAINARKRPESSSSKESHLHDLIVKKVQPKAEISVASIGSLDVPRKSNLSTRFPSITRITKICSSVFNKKSQNIIDTNSDKGTKLYGDKSKDYCIRKHQQNTFLPTAANALLHLRKDQDLNLEYDQCTTSAEEHSEYSQPEEDIDDYFKPYCFFCFCI